MMTARNIVLILWLSLAWGCIAPTSDQAPTTAQESALAERIIQENHELYEQGTPSAYKFPVLGIANFAEGYWLKGDLHAHTTYSDGDSEVSTVIKIAEDLGLDFFSITDHNTSLHWSDPAYQSSRLTLLYGVEWTTPQGHANIWASKPYDFEKLIRPTIDHSSPQDAIAAIHELRNTGIEALFSINHPHEPFGGKWSYDFAQSKEADCIEIWNAQYTWPNLSFLTINTILSNYLRQGARLCMVGGSDSHTHRYDNIQTYYHGIGMPTTWVLAKSNNARDVLKGLREGITFISSSVDGPQIRFSAQTEMGKFWMGQPLPVQVLNQKSFFAVKVLNAQSFLGESFPYSLAVVMKNGRPFRFTISKHANFEFEFADIPETGDIYYAKLVQFPSNVSLYLLSQLLQVGWTKALSSPIAFVIDQDIHNVYKQ